MIVKDGRGAGFVPREDGLLRIAAPVPSRSEATPEAILRSLREILSPYEIDITHIDWCGVFGTRRRVSSSSSKHSRVFLVGDALHVHSPRAGIGMNFSIQDGKSTLMRCISSLTSFSIQPRVENCARCQGNLSPFDFEDV